MVRFDGRMLTVALHALLLGCGRQPRQPERPAVAPSPAVQPQATPPAADSQAHPKKTPKDSSGSQTYPWKSGPIATL